MPKILFGLILAGTLAMPLTARAASNTTVGVGTGAIAGALVAGPVGAVAGAIVGGVVGASSERPRRYRRVRRSAAPAALPPRRMVQRASPAPRAGALTPTVSAEPSPVSTGSTNRRWTDPR